MKYKDYLILPAILMYLLYASCAYIAKENRELDTVPDAVISPQEIVWGCSEDESHGEYWYANGERGTDYFAVIEGRAGANQICFFEAGSPSENVRYSVNDLHLNCTDNGRKYDIIFPNEMTAYDTVSGTYYQRGDYSRLFMGLTSGKFINETNPNDWYVFKESGKSLEYFGDKAFPGKWTLSTSSSISVFDNRTEKTYVFDILLDRYGDVGGFSFDGIIYSLST